MGETGAPSTGALAANHWRAYEKATSEHVQPGAGAAPDRKRPERIAAELSVLFRSHRARSGADPSPSPVARHAEVHGLWALRPLHRRRGVILTGRLRQSAPPLIDESIDELRDTR